jgi:rare lipoprotein A (peptidoglycan hydrolase)
MKNRFITKRLAVAITVLSLATVSIYGIATAQTEEGIANFYSDKFQGKKTARGAVYDKNNSLRRTKPYLTGPR